MKPTGMEKETETPFIFPYIPPNPHFLGERMGSSVAIGNLNDVNDTRTG